MANLIKIDTTGYTSDYILLLDSPSSVGRYVTVKDTGTNPTFFASNAIVISTTSGYTFFDGNSTEYIRTNKGSLSFLTTTSNWRLLNTVPYTTLGHAVLSTISTKNMSVFGDVSSFAQVTVKNIMNVQAIDTQNVATVNAIPVVTASNMASTVAGLGTLAYLSSISFMNNYFASTVNGLGTYGIISSSLLTSSMQGLGPPYVSSSWLTSTMQGLGTLGYVSYSQFNSSIIGITLGFRSNITSTVAGLGTFGYISSQSLISSIRDLGQEPYTYISSKQLQSTTAGITTFNTATLVSTVRGLGQFYISTQGLVSTTVGISNVNASNITSTINNLGHSYISSLSLQSTVAGLGTLGYMSISQLTSTMIGLSNATIAANTSIDNLGTNQYISAPSLVSSVVGLGSAPYSYISGPSLVSTVNGLGSVLLSTPSLLQKATALTNSVYNTSAITSTMNGLGNYYLSTSGDYTVVGRLGVYLGSINAITRAGNTPVTRTVTTVASGFNYPVGLAVDSTGVYVADLTNNLIRLYTPAGVSTYASVSSPGGLAIDPAGNIYISRLYAGSIVKIDPFRNQTTIASGISFPYGLAIDSRGTVYVVAAGTNEIYQLIGGVLSRLAGSVSGFADGDANSAQFKGPYSVAVDSADNIFVADTGNGRIRQIKSSFIISLVQTTTGLPYYLVMDGAGNIYYTTPYLNVIMKRDTVGTVTTYAGSGTAGFTNGVGTAAQFNFPTGLALDSAGNLYVADNNNNAVRIIDTSRNVTTLFSGGSYPQALNNPWGVAVDSSGIYVADTGNSRICSIVPGSAVPSSVATLASTASGAYQTAIDAAGNIFVAIRYSNIIQKIDMSSGTPSISTYSGSAGQGYADGPIGSAQFFWPSALVFDSVGNLYVGDTRNCRIRKIDTGGNVTTVAGNGAIADTDGSGTSASVALPVGLNIDINNTIYITTNSGATSGGALLRKFYSGYVSTMATMPNYDIPFQSAVISPYEIYVSTIRGLIYKLSSTDGITYTSTVIAGSYNANTSVNGIGISATFNGNDPGARGALGLAADLNGNLYISEGGGNRIRKMVIATRDVTYFAGTGSAGSTDGSLLASSFNDPMYLSFNAARTILYVSEYYNNSIRKITLDAISPPTINVIAGQSGVTVSTLAGSLQMVGYGDGTGTGASFAYPDGLAVDSTGNIYVADVSNQRIRKITPAGVVTTFAGSGAIGSADGTGTGASFNNPRGVAVDSAGNVYVADTNNGSIRKITAAGVVTTIAGNASFNNPDGIAVDSAGNVYVADTYNNILRKISPAGIITTIAGTSLTYPHGIVIDSAGNIYVAEVGNGIIQKITPAGVVTTFAGSVDGYADGTGTAAQFSFPRGLAIDSAGNIYVADVSNQRIRKITPAGIVTTFAGSGVKGFADGPAATAAFYYPFGIAVDSAGNIYVADSTNQIIRKITFGSAGYLDANGTSAQFNQPYGIRLDASHNIYVADTFNHMIRKIDTAANVTTVAGQVTPGLTNGVGAAAQFNFPTDVAVDGTNLYVADYSNNVIRKIDSTQKVTIYGGSPTGVSGNSLTPPGLFSGPIGVFVSGSYLYLTDSANNAIKRMFGGTVVSTVASGLSSPTAIAFDSAGTMYVTDNHRVITIPNTTYAGTGSAGSADGIWSSATFNAPNGIAIDSAGIVYVSDTGNNLLRKIAPAATNNTLFYANSTEIWRLNPPATSFYLTSTTNLNSGLAYDGTTIYATRDNSIYAYNTLTTASYTLVGSSAGYANGTSGVTFNQPKGLAIDSSGKNLYVCDYTNSAIRKVQISPISVTTVASVSNPIAIALDSYSRYAYVTNFGSVYRVSLLQGNTTQIASGLGAILGITIDPTNTYAYITESFQFRIIQINLQTFARQTIAGSGTNASVDGISLLASFSLPWGIIYDPTTALIYNTDTDTGLIRTITTPMYLSTIIGLEVIRTAPTIAGTLTISGATVGGLLYNSGGATASAAVIIGKGIIMKTDLRAGNNTVTARTFTASGGTPGGPYGFYYGDGTHVTSISDLRTKEDIRPIRNALSIVRKLQAVEYTKRDDPTRRWIGYIAQDIEELLPELVTTDDSPEKWKSVQYTNLPGLIIEAIKELKEKYRLLSYAANV